MRLVRIAHKLQEGKLRSVEWIEIAAPIHTSFQAISVSGSRLKIAASSGIITQNEKRKSKDSQKTRAKEVEIP